MRTAIIDGDVPCFTECASAASRGENPFGDYVPDIKAIADSASEVVLGWAATAEADKVIFVYTHESRENFRKDILPTQYKAGRPESKPAGYYEVLEELKKRFPHETVRGVEGDDVCGMIHTSDKSGETVVCSTDKDMQTLYGWIYDPYRQAFPRMITPNEATHFWMTQVLTGDSADGYKGCVGIGPKKAATALGRVNNDVDPDEYVAELWEKVIDVYEQKMTTPTPLQDAIVQARCARILHRDDYDAENHRIKLWSPSHCFDWKNLRF